MRVLGIDPGSRVTGYGVIDCTRSGGGQLRHCDSGCVHTGGGELAPRLRTIFQSLDALIGEWAPTEVAVERVFMSRNPDSALKLGQARGAAICAAAARERDVFEYAPSQIKQVVSGRGAADKGQVQFMMRLMLGLSQEPAEDAADALAVAVCHARLRHVSKPVLAAASGAEP